MPIGNLLWESVKAAGGMLGHAAKETGLKGKLQTELLLISREIDGRKRAFGEELYDFVEPLSKSPDFFSANDRLTDTLRGPLLTAQREISVLNMKRAAVQKKVAETNEKEKGAYVSATNMAETLQNTAIRAGYAGSHAKLKTDLSALEVQIRDFKQLFGLEMYQIFVDLEDTAGWLPTVRDIRSMYDQARREVEKIDARRQEKEKELIKLGGVPMTQSSEPSQVNGTHHEDDDSTPAYFKEAAAKDAGTGGTAAAAYVAPGPAVPQYGAASSMQQQPYNNSHPSYGSTSASSQPPQHAYADPFGSSMTALHQQQQQPQQQQPVDLFSSFGSASTPASNDFFGSPPLTQHAPAMSSVGSGSISGLPGTGSAAAMNHGDPFAVAMMDGSSSSHHDAFGPPMGSGNFLMGAASVVPPPSNDDPFAAFDSLAAPQQQPQQQHTSQGNPMFQY